MHSFLVLDATPHPARMKEYTPSQNAGFAAAFLYKDISHAKSNV
jgi:hypothetical protein